MANLENQKIGETELKDASGGIVYNGEKLVCPTCGEDILHGTEMLDANGNWVIRWYCIRCKVNVFYTPLVGANNPGLTN